MKSVAPYLLSIMDAIENIEHHKNAGINSDTGSKAMMYELVTIGEAVTKIPGELRAKYPQVKWREIVAFRNVLVHGYLGVNMDVVKDVVEHELELLALTVNSMLKEL